MLLGVPLALGSWWGLFTIVPITLVIAEGKLGEAGQKLEELKRAIDKLNTRQR